MVQIQSSLFPLYDRNPQTFAADPFNPRPGDYQTATVTVMRGGRGRQRDLAAGGSLNPVPRPACAAPPAMIV